MMIPKPEVTEVDVAWVCLADVNGFLCKVEVKIRLGAGSYSTQL